MCSSNEISFSQFNQELFYRLNVVAIDIPNLKDRREDILPLIDYYLLNSESISGQKKIVKNFTKEALMILQSYDWPGNILQLKNIVENSLTCSTKVNEMGKDFLPSELIGSVEEKFLSMNVSNFLSLPLNEAKKHFEFDYLQAQIGKFSGNVSKTAKFIGMERSALHRKLKLLGVTPNDDVMES
jgi:two-component system nitrogen regulation response regulator NtrX